MTDDRDRAIVPAMIRLGHDLGYRVVAEGIENPQVYRQVAAWSCDEAQGYWIGKPMSADKFEVWLASRPENAVHFATLHSSDCTCSSASAEARLGPCRVHA
jgi:EAL domain-containing protein (putative c-di-GMP-specific phosphodiesterase class I)